MADAKEKEKGSTKQPPAAEGRAGAPSTPEAASEASSSEAETEELVLTVNRQTGEIIRIERILESGNRQEFAEQEYAQFFGTEPEVYHAYGYHEGYSQGLVDYEASLTQGAPPLETAYYQGMADYEATLLAQAGQEAASSPEELAYYQGMADYEAALTAQPAEPSSEELAYHQGMADAQAAYTST